MPVLMVQLDSDAGKVTSALKESAGAAEQLAGSTEKAKAKMDGLSERARNTVSALQDMVAKISAIDVAVAAAGAAALAIAAMGKAAYDASVALVDTGGALADLEAKTGISADALQKLAYAGSLVGVSQEQIAGAATKMEKALANGDAVFGKLGLSVSKLRAMKPDEAFAQIAEKIATIRDPAGQAAAAMEVFGKAGADLLPMMKLNFAETSAEAERLGLIISGKTISAADALGDEATKVAQAWRAVQNQFAAVIVENPAFLDALNSIVEALGKVAQWAIANRGALSALLTAIIGVGQSAATGFRMFADWAVKAADKLRYLVDMVPGLRGLLNIASDVATKLKMANEEGSGLSSSARLVGGGMDFRGGNDAESEVNKQIAAVDKAMADYVRSYEAMEKEISGFIIRTHKLATKEDEEFWKAQMKRADEYGAKLLERIQKHQKEMATIGEKNADVFAEMYARAGDQVGGIFDDVASRVGGAWGTLFHNLGSVMQRFVAENKAGLGDWVAGHQKAIGAIVAGAEALWSAYQGGRAAGSAGKGAMSGAVSGAAAGAAIGTLFGPGVGTAIGAGIGFIGGGIAGFFGGRKGASEKRAQELAELRAEFDALMKQAERAGILFDTLFDTSSANGLRQAIADIKGELDLHAEAHQKLQEAVERYGFTIEELGPKFRQQKLDEMAGQLLQDFQLLTASGIDQAVVLERMGASLSEYVQTAIRAGGEVPAAMRPMIEAAIENGELVDENGQAYESAEAAGITYATTMSQKFQELIDKITDMVNAILGVPTDRTINWRHVQTGNPPRGGPGGKFGWNDDGSPDNDGDPSNSYAMGGEAFFPYRRGGHLIRVGDAPGGEYGVFTPAGKMGGGGSAALVAAVDRNTTAVLEGNALLRQSEEARRRDMLILPALVNGERAKAMA